MGMFIVVLLFNIYWLILYGVRGYIDLYTGRVSLMISVFAWFYSILGVISLLLYWL
jgi:hypothetical protein